MDQTEIDFGKVAVGDLRVRGLTLANTGRSELTITTFSIESATTEIAIGADMPDRIPPGSSVDISLVYSPIDVGEDLGTLTVEGNDQKGPKTIALRGEGIINGIGVSHDGEPCGETEGSLSFGRVVPGDMVERTITLRALGKAPLTIFSVEAEPGTSAEFSIDPVERGTVLQPDASIEIKARYAPTDGGLDSGAFVITTDAADGGSTRIPICGEGVAPAICASPNPLDLGPIAQGSTGRRTLRVESCGLEPLNLESLELSADASNPTDPGFALENLPGLPTTLQPGEYVEVDVAYSATTIVNASGFVKAVSNALGLPQAYIPIAARGAQPCGLDVLPSRVSFVQGGSTQQQVLIANNGASECSVTRLEVTTGSTEFALVNPPAVPFGINPGGAITVGIDYAQSAPGAQDLGTLEVEGGSGVISVDLVGEAPAADVCSIEIVPQFANFGAVEPGSIRTMGISVNNIGSDPCFIKRVEIAAGSDPAFQETSSNLGLIFNGRSKTLSVAFRPTTYGPANGTLRIQLSDSLVGGTTLDYDVPLFGSGLDDGICVEPRHLPFGPSVIGAETMDFRIYACGGRAVTVTALDWKVANPDVTMPTPPALPFTLQPGDNQVVTVRYAPNQAPLGDYAAITVRSNDPVEPAIDVEITGGQEVVPYEAGRYLYYWQIANPIGGDVMKLPLQGNTTSFSFWGPRAGKSCTGCHVLSPDGKYVALIEFAGAPTFKVVDTTSNLVLQSLPSEVAGANYMSWRPDVTTTPPYQFVFDAGGDLKVATLFDGYIGEVSGAADPTLVELQPSWGPNGKIAFARGMQAQAGQGGQGTWGIQGSADIMLIDETGGTPVPVLGASGNNAANYYPSFSPNGNWIAFTQSVSASGSISATDARLWLVDSANGGNARDLANANAAVGDGASSYPTWSVDGRYVSFSSNRAGGQGDWDIYIAPIDPTSGADSAANNVVEANTSAFEHAAQWSP